MDKVLPQAVTALPGKFLVVCLVSFLAGCAGTPQSHKIPFTHELREYYHLSDDDLRQLQYYTSGTITLHREPACGQTKVTDGSLVTESCTVLDDVIIHKGTPGVAVEVGENWVGISFEAGDSIAFGSAPSSRKDWHGRYGMVADTWQDEIGTLQFDGKTYTALDDSWTVYLLINEEALHKVVKKKRVLPGRRLGQ